MIVSGDQRKDSATHPTLYPTSPKFPSPLSYTPYVLLSCWGLQAVLQTFLLFFDIIWFPKFVYFRTQEDEIALIWAPRISLFFFFSLSFSSSFFFCQHSVHATHCLLGRCRFFRQRTTQHVKCLPQELFSNEALLAWEGNFFSFRSYFYDAHDNT